MKFIITALLLFATAFFCAAQCPEFSLSDLHALQRAGLDEKGNRILDQGFDLRKEFVMRGETTRSYSRCWRFEDGDDSIFEQLIWWNVTTGAITFLTLYESSFKHLRESIVGRQTSGKITENPDFYAGKLFLYRFGTRRVGRQEYYSISIQYR